MRISGFKKIFLLLAFLNLARLHAQQWTTNGTHIYNSNPGNVGIGTGATPPVSPLTVTTPAAGDIALFRATNNNNNRIVIANNVGQLNLGIGSTTSHGYLWSSTNKFFIGNDGDPAIFVDGMGNNSKVGIGTATPSEKLDISGTVKASALLTASVTYNQNDNFTLEGRTSGHYALTWGQDSWGSHPTAWLSGHGGIKFFSQGLVRMAITMNGNIGIGTSDPQAKLAVNGDVFAKKVKVTQTGWPDYVFEKEYHLPSLREVEQFIQRNKHLSDVPSAKEIETNGLNLGDNHAVLLRKIEEITLYLIQKDKEVELLSIKLATQEKLIKDLQTRLSVVHPKN